MLCSIATKLGESELGEIRALEQDMLRELEERLGVSLVAVAA
jgi:hypothetical protein